MAVRKRQHGPDMQALIARAVSEIRHLNPHIGASQNPLDEETYAHLHQDTEELERLWDELDRQRGSAPAGEPAADAVNADRGE